MEKYNIVLFKNKKKKRIIKKFVILENAKSFYNKMIKDNEDILFEIRYEGGKECKYELALVEVGKNQKYDVYTTDELGRNIRVKLNEEGFNIMEIKPFLKEEKIYDIQKNKKLTSKEFISEYLKKSDVKLISVLNNKVIVQKDDKINLFSLKNEIDSIRFVESLSKFFIKEKRSDCMFITDTSTPQKKYLLSILENYGFDKKILYRKYTTFPSSPQDLSG